MQPLKMVDLHSQYIKIKPEIDNAIQSVLDSTQFILGHEVNLFAQELQNYLQVPHVIPCANGTDALQLALMALELPPKSEILVPTFNYIAAAEAISLLGHIPVFVDASADYNMSIADINNKITKNTKAIIAVHLFGQCADMDKIMKIASSYNIPVIEDNAQSMGSICRVNGADKYAGTIGNIGTTSFFPAKNLGCFGDGGAVFTHDAELAFRIKTIANHGQSRRYYHDMVGINSRLDTLQAAVLRVKLKHLDSYNTLRIALAYKYNAHFKNHKYIQTPLYNGYSTYVFHQYVMRVKGGYRDGLKQHLDTHSIPNMIYYPVPLHLQGVFKMYGYTVGDYPIAEALCSEVIALPMQTELDDEQIHSIVNAVDEYFNSLQ
ncbi:MAG: DegT/DnrJ/EryC1/StrS family aminotransferase [Cytophagales bacterium]|nr:DegT/DnrJ/EryC1/StrS family aminotransferase [Cytophagales bacterium]